MGSEKLLEEMTFDWTSEGHLGIEIGEAGDRKSIPDPCKCSGFLSALYIHSEFSWLWFLPVLFSLPRKLFLQITWLAHSLLKDDFFREDFPGILASIAPRDFVISFPYFMLLHSTVPLCFYTVICSWCVFPHYNISSMRTMILSLLFTTVYPSSI